jgi:hypothetical protein
LTHTHALLLFLLHARLCSHSSFSTSLIFADSSRFFVGRFSPRLCLLTLCTTTTTHLLHLHCSL